MTPGRGRPGSNNGTQGKGGPFKTLQRALHGFCVPILNQGNIGFSSMQIQHCSDLRREHGPARDSGKIHNGLVCVLVLSLGLAGFTGGGVSWPSLHFLCVSGAPQASLKLQQSLSPKLFLEDNEGLEPLVLPIPPLPSFLSLSCAQWTRS